MITILIFHVFVCVCAFASYAYPHRVEHDSHSNSRSLIVVEVPQMMVVHSYLHVFVFIMCIDVHTQDDIMLCCDCVVGDVKMFISLSIHSYIHQFTLSFILSFTLIGARNLFTLSFTQSRVSVIMVIHVWSQDDIMLFMIMYSCIYTSFNSVSFIYSCIWW